MNNSFDVPAGRGQRGLALVLTLLVLVLLVTAVLEFDRSTRTAMRAAGNFRDGMKAFHLATSGVAAAQAVLKDDMVKTGAVDSLDELWATPFPPYPVGDGAVSLAAQDEGGKLNLNALVTKDGNKPTNPFRIEQLKRLLALKDLDPELADAIVDWLDRDDIPGPRGAEASYYQALDRPYACKNGPLETLAELHLIKGVTDEVYRTISPYLTVYWNVPGAADDRINVNTADPLILESLPERVSDGVFRFPLSAEQVEQLVAARPFSSLNQLNRVAGLPPAVVSAISPQLDVGSRFFSIYSEGEANGVKKSVIAVVERAGEPVLRYWRLGD
ncbi:MAG: type II secretion system minor pseudopilin GspK [Nitrospirota bacterium]